METIKTGLKADGVTVGIIEVTLDGRYSAMRTILRAGIELADAVAKDVSEDDEVREDFDRIERDLHGVLLRIS